MPAPIKITDQQIQYMHTHCRTKTAAQISRDLGLRVEVVRRYMMQHGLKLSRPEACRLRGEARIGFTSYTADDDQYIRDHYLDIPIKRIAADLGRSNCGVMGRIRAMGLQVPSEVISRNKKQSYFKKGQEARNKGVPMLPHIRERMQHTFFKKGNLPANTRADGDISIRTDKRGVKYKFIRIGLSRWEALARYNYRKEHGPIPHGHVIIHRDGDTLNCDPPNLMMITKKEHMLRNSIHNLPPEIKDTINTLSLLNKKIRRNEKQD